MSVDNEKLSKKIEFEIMSKPINVFLYVLAHDFGYVMKIVNNNDSKQFDAAFTFTLDNIKIEDGNKWTVKLAPKSCTVKHMSLIDIKKQAQYKYSCTMQCTESNLTEEKIL